MEDSFNNVVSSLASKELLLKKALYLEALALQDKKDALSNSFDLNSLHIELISLYDEYKRYEALLNSLFKQYEDKNYSSFPLDIPYSFYISYSFNGLTLKDICDKLLALSKRICDILNLLNKICGTLGHNFKYVKTDEIFDFESLELTYEKHDLYYCTCCGSLKLLDVSDEVKIGISDIEAFRLRQIRFLNNFVPFALPFSLVDVPSEIKEINR